MYMVIKEFFDTAEFLRLTKGEQFAYQQELEAKLDYINVMRYAKGEVRNLLDVSFIKSLR